MKDVLKDRKKQRDREIIKFIREKKHTHTHTHTHTHGERERERENKFHDSEK